MVIDGLPMDNKTLNTGVLASDAPGSLTAFNNRGIDFTNRAADINPEDIESLVVLKGPEASALYGIDAANGAIVITTKHGQSGGGMEYSNNFRVERTGTRPQLQRNYGPTSVDGNTLGSFSYFGNPYAAGTPFFDNVDGFFKTALTQSHNLSFSGASPDNRVNFRLGVSSTKQAGVVPNSDYGRINITGRSQVVANSWSPKVAFTHKHRRKNRPTKHKIGPL